MRIGVLLPSGGMRCFYQLGVLERVRDLVAPRVLAGISGGALAAVIYLSETTEPMLEAARSVARFQRPRARPRRLLDGRSPFPHGEILERESRKVLTDARLQRVVESPADVHIMAAALEDGRPYPLAGAPVMLAHALEIGPLRKLWLHPTVGRAMGFRPHWFDVTPDTRPEDLFEMLLASSCFPPLTKPIERDGLRFFDGAFVTSMPDWRRLEAYDDIDEIWIIHTRRDQRGLFTNRPGVRHVSPSSRLGVGIWDYGNETGMARAYHIGLRDGLRLRQTLHTRPSRSSHASVS